MVVESGVPGLAPVTMEVRIQRIVTGGPAIYPPIPVFGEEIRVHTITGRDIRLVPAAKSYLYIALKTNFCVPSNAMNRQAKGVVETSTPNNFGRVSIMPTINSAPCSWL